MRTRPNVVRIILALAVLSCLVAATPATAATTEIQLDPQLQKYVPGSSGWANSPWMTSPACRDRGGDLSAWVQSVITDSPRLLAQYQPATFGRNVAPASQARNAEITQGYKNIAARMSDSVPADYCVNDVAAWTKADPAAKPFGLPFGGSVGDSAHRSIYSCTPEPATPVTTGAERTPCTGFFINCMNPMDADLLRCAKWDAFSDRYVREVSMLRRAALVHNPARAEGAVLPTSSGAIWTASVIAALFLALLITLSYLRLNRKRTRAAEETDVA
jgi:hypothetical protein